MKDTYLKHFFRYGLDLFKIKGYLRDWVEESISFKEVKEFLSHRRLTTLSIAGITAEMFYDMVDSENCCRTVRVNIARITSAIMLFISVVDDILDESGLTLDEKMSYLLKYWLCGELLNLRLKWDEPLDSFSGKDCE